MTEETIEQLEARIKQLQNDKLKAERDAKAKADKDAKVALLEIARSHVQAVVDAIKAKLGTQEFGTQFVWLEENNQIMINALVTHPELPDRDHDFRLYVEDRSWNNKDKSIVLVVGYNRKTIQIKKDASVSHDKLVHEAVSTILHYYVADIRAKRRKDNEAPSLRLHDEFPESKSKIRATEDPNKPVKLCTTIDMEMTEGEARALLNAIAAIKKGAV